MNQLPLTFPAAPSYLSDDFLVSDANREAQEWVTQPQRWNSYGLRLCGPRASGRTHLAHVFAQQQRATFLALPVQTLSGNAVLDNADAQDEQSLFHLLNIAKESGHKLLLLFGERPLQEVFRLPDLLSRLNALPQATLLQPDDALLLAVLRKQMSDRQLRVGDETFAYLLPRIDRSFAFVRQLAQALDNEALKTRKAITPALARAVLESLKART